MPFFLPRELVEFEYLGSDNEDSEYTKMAEDYSKEIDFAFFVVNFGYSKRDYEEISETEKAFIFKAWENKMVLESSLVNRAAFNAIINANRKKGKKYVNLWEKNKYRKVGDETMLESREKFERLLENEKKSNGDWVKQIYMANGRRN